MVHNYFSKLHLGGCKNLSTLFCIEDLCFSSALIGDEQGNYVIYDIENRRYSSVSFFGNFDVC
jgi:hypothetical protein